MAVDLSVIRGAIGYMQPDDHPLLATNMLRELQTERHAQLAGLADSADWDDFQRRRGILEGLDIAIARCENAQKLLQG